jgi:hypothetical protein
MESSGSSDYAFGSALNEFNKYNKVAIVLTSLQDKVYYLYLLDLIEKSIRAGVDIFIYDLCLEDFPSSIPFPNKGEKEIRSEITERLYGYRKAFTTHISNCFEIGVVEQNVEVVKCYSKYSGHTVNTLLNQANLSTTARNSILSVLATDLLKTNNFDKNLSQFLQRMVIDLIEYSLEIRNICLDIFSRSDFEAVVVLNGRGPDQAATIEACELSGIKYYSLEHGGRPGIQYHFQNFQTQNTSAFQDYFWEKEGDIDETERVQMLSQAKEWLKRRRVLPPTFGSPIRRSNTTYFKTSRKRLALFTSSISEFDAYALESNEVNQLQAFEMLLNELDSETNVEVVIRIHPNQINYSLGDLSELYKVFKNYSVRIVMPWEDDSSYDIAKEADSCFFWNSTLGLETLISSERNIYVMAETFYDKLPGVDFWDFKNMRNKNIKSYFLKDADAALLFVYYQFLGHGERVSNSEKMKILAKQLDEISAVYENDTKGILHQKFSFFARCLWGVLFRQTSPSVHLFLLSNLVGRRIAIHLYRKMFFRLDMH